MKTTKEILALAGLLLLTLLSVASAKAQAGKLKFADYSEKCKIPKNAGELVKSHEECDSSRGLQCQRYQKGEMCGCPINSVLSWDEVSKECRRKSRSECFPEDPATSQFVPFNQKCHKRAICRAIEMTSEETGNKETRHLCDCDHSRGFEDHPDKGLGSCVSVDSASGVRSWMTTSSVIIYTALLVFFQLGH